jgi:hypothetical protein
LIGFRKRVGPGEVRSGCPCPAREAARPLKCLRDRLIEICLRSAAASPPRSPKAKTACGGTGRSGVGSRPGRPAADGARHRAETAQIVGQPWLCAGDWRTSPAHVNSTLSGRLAHRPYRTNDRAPPGRTSGPRSWSAPRSRPAPPCPGPQVRSAPSGRRPCSRQ